MEPGLGVQRATDAVELRKTGRPTGARSTRTPLGRDPRYLQADFHGCWRFRALKTRCERPERDEPNFGDRLDAAISPD